MNKTLNRREFMGDLGALAGTAALSLTLGNRAFGAATANGQADRRNFLILRSDEHNPKMSSPYGHPFVKTPNMERLARMGTVYENHYCPSPLCMPSRSAFMSGHPVFQIQTYSNCLTTRFNYPSYGKVLADQGIYTAYFGKSDVYNAPGALGFSENHGTGTRSPGSIGSRKDIRQSKGDRAHGYGPSKKPFATDEHRMEQALEWLRTKAPKLDRPWTMEVNISKPHFPVYVTQELWDMYAAHADLPKYGVECESAKHPYAQDLRKFFATAAFTEESTRGLRRGYYGCVTFVDQQLGRILDTLEKTGLLSNTIVAYTSDHGDMMGKFGMWWKRSLYDDSARVPLIVAGPGFRKGARVKTAVGQLDLQASIFRALNRKRPAQWWGTPLQDIADNDPNHVAFCEYQGEGTRGSAFMVRKGKWKLIHCCEAPHQLFDMENDPEELKNLAETRRDVFDDLEKELRNLCSPEEENRRAEEFINKQIAAVASMQKKKGKGGKKKSQVEDAEND